MIVLKISIFRPTSIGDTLYFCSVYFEILFSNCKQRIFRGFFLNIFTREERIFYEVKVINMDPIVCNIFPIL